MKSAEMMHWWTAIYLGCGEFCVCLQPHCHLSVLDQDSILLLLFFGSLTLLHISIVDHLDAVWWNFQTICHLCKGGRHKRLLSLLRCVRLQWLSHVSLCRDAFQHNSDAVVRPAQQVHAVQGWYPVSRWHTRHPLMGVSFVVIAFVYFVNKVRVLSSAHKYG